MEDILSQVANLGFPIVVSIYLLVRIENKLDTLTQSINELARVIDTLKTYPLNRLS
ncbi:YvrJ protein family protein [Caldanaerobius fijiensis DSM 17918]|uniref:YvrJ protein family protein n=1 Tax=Caldanaerobius fijiensis DSM 17918 TaxID=1121256 RepID=A0A1M5DFA5_9THEO|nr:YvrJ protein family protein [Caldanaerobius fijiensis DSM 17918]